MCFYSAQILSCVRDFHISHTLVNHNRTVVTQRMNSKYVCFQFEPRGPAKAQADSETTPQIYRPHRPVGLLDCCPAPLTVGHTPHTFTAGDEWGVERCLWGAGVVVGGLHRVNYWNPTKTHLDGMHSEKNTTDIKAFKKWLIKQFSFILWPCLITYN